LSCELYSANITCPEGQIFNNHTSSCENKKVDTTTENGDGTTQDDNGTTQDGDGTIQDDDPHELVYNIKSKGAGRTLRKLEEDEKQRIFITINGTEGTNVKYLHDYFYEDYKPDEVFLNNNQAKNNNGNYSITLDKEGENKIEVIWNNKLTYLSNMFFGCTSIVSLDFSSFDTSDVEEMDNMFGDCSSLVSLDLSKFITSNVKNMNYMFQGCSSLKSLDLSNFITSNVEKIGYMFKGCSSLVSLDLSNFIISNIDSNNMKQMFYGCSSLLYINLLNYSEIDIFDKIPNKDIEFPRNFYNFKNLKFLCLKCPQI